MQLFSLVTVPEYELSAVRLITKRSIEDGTTKHVQVNAFGRKMRLNLKDNNDFNERIKDMKVYIAETSKNGKLRYSEDPSASVSRQLRSVACGRTWIDDNWQLIAYRTNTHTHF